MSIKVVCPACNTPHSIHDRLAGRSIRCPTCDESIQVTGPVESSDDEMVEVLDDEDGDSDLVEVMEMDQQDPSGNYAAKGRSASASGSRGDVVDVVEVEVIEDDLSADDDFDDFPLDPPVDSRRTDSDDDEDEVEDIVFEKKELPKDDMDMTPMVDVTFLLLIFFMITASFTSEKVIEEPKMLSDKPSSQQREEPEKILDTVRVQVDEFNAYTIILPGGEDRQASSKQDLVIALEDARKEIVTGANDDALKMAVEAHVDSIHAAVIAALDAGRSQGFSSFQVTVVEEFD